MADVGTALQKYCIGGEPAGGRCQWGTHVPRVNCALYTSLIVIVSVIVIVLAKA